MGLAQDRLTILLDSVNAVRDMAALRVNDPPKEQLFNHIVYKQITEQLDNILNMIETELRAKETYFNIKYEDIKGSISSTAESVPISIDPIIIADQPIGVKV